MKHKKVVLTTIIVAVVLLLGIGTYAFFTATIEGNIDNNNIVQTTGSLSIEYVEGQNINAEGIVPGWSGTKTFTVKNTGTLSVSYDIVFLDLINTFINDEVIYNGTCSSNQTTCDGIEQGVVDIEEFFIKQNITIEPNEEHSYEIEIEFIETDANQDYNNQSTLSGKISIYETGTYKIPLDITVDIVDNMIPVAWDESTLIKADKTNQENNWYDYDNQKWANAVLVTSASRENYKSSAQGTPIIEDDILAYYTYIPRYKYLLWNANNNINCLNDNCDEQEIMIEFERKTTQKSTGSTNGQWLTHPAFTFGDSELNGIWVGKFTTSPDTESTCYTSPSVSNCNLKSISPIIKPNLEMWRYTRVATMFSVSKHIETMNMYGLTSYINADSHMMKNMEWGAVAYLSHSKYGKYGNDTYSGENKQLYINNYRVISQKYKTETGCSGGAPDASQNQTRCPHPYPGLTLEATGASTTGNIYGIYDMSGGATEYVMGQIVEEGKPIGTFYADPASGTWGSIPELKYYDSYKYVTINLSHGRGYLGDATRETLKIFGKGVYDGWYGDTSGFPDTTYSWFTRGDNGSGGANAGVFAFSPANGNGSIGSHSFRIVLVLE